MTTTRRIFTVLLIVAYVVTLVMLWEHLEWWGRALLVAAPLARVWTLVEE
jgi:hypothetical protein